MYIFLNLLLAALALIVGAILGTVLKSPLWKLARASSGAWSPLEISGLQNKFSAVFRGLLILGVAALFIVVLLFLGYDYLIHSPLEHGKIPQAASNFFWRLVYLATFVVGFAFALE